MSIDIHGLMSEVLPAILPVIIAYFNNPVWPAEVKAVIPLVVCMALATVEVLIGYFQAGMGFPVGWSAWIATMVKAYAICMASYAALWKNPLVGRFIMPRGAENNISDRVENNFGTGSR